MRAHAMYLVQGSTKSQMQYTMLFLLFLVVVVTVPTSSASRQWPYGYKLPKWIQNIQNATAPNQSDSDESDESGDSDKSESEPISDEGESQGGCDSGCNEMIFHMV